MWLPHYGPPCWPPLSLLFPCPVTPDLVTALQFLRDAKCSLTSALDKLLVVPWTLPLPLYFLPITYLPFRPPLKIHSLSLILPLFLDLSSCMEARTLCTSAILIPNLYKFGCRVCLLWFIVSSMQTESYSFPSKQHGAWYLICT